MNLHIFNNAFGGLVHYNSTNEQSALYKKITIIKLLELCNNNHVTYIFFSTSSEVFIGIDFGINYKLYIIEDMNNYIDKLYDIGNYTIKNSIISYLKYNKSIYLTLPPETKLKIMSIVLGSK